MDILRSKANMGLALKRAGFLQGDVKIAIGSFPEVAGAEGLFLEGLIYYAVNDTPKALALWKGIIDKDFLPEVVKERFSIDVDPGDGAGLRSWRRQAAASVVSLMTELGRTDEARKVWDRFEKVHVRAYGTAA